MVFEKSNVNGPHANPVFSWLRRNSKLYKGNGIAEKIQWNFQKFIVSSPQGQVEAVYHPNEEPFSFEDKLFDKEN